MSKVEKRKVIKFCVDNRLHEQDINDALNRLTGGKTAHQAIELMCRAEVEGYQEIMPAYRTYATQKWEVVIPVAALSLLK